MATHFMQEKEKRSTYRQVKNELIARGAWPKQDGYYGWAHESYRPVAILNPRTSKGCIDERNKPSDLIVDVVAKKRTIDEVDNLIRGKIVLK